MIDFNHLHHAYLLVGDQDKARILVLELFEKAGYPLAGSPDFFVLKEETFGIDAARNLSVMAARKAFGEKKVFFIAPETITLEAQNALLKTFEEPPLGTHFFLALRDDGMVLPTLRSRVVTLPIEHSVVHKDAETFLKASLKERLAFVKKFVDAEKNLSSFLDDLLTLSRNQHVYEARLVSDQRGASARLILEHLALTLDNI